MNPIARHLALILGTGLVATAAADCGDDSTNLYRSANGANCDFDSDASLWFGFSGTTGSHDATRSTPDDGADPGTGSLQLVDDGSGGGAGSSVCVAATGMAGGTLNFGAMFLRQSGVEVSCSVTLFNYGTNSACEGGTATTASAVFPPLEDWALSSGSVMVATDPSYFRIQTDCSDFGGGYTVNADNFFISPTSTVPVELESFGIE